MRLAQSLAASVCFAVCAAAPLFSATFGAGVAPAGGAPWSPGPMSRSTGNLRAQAKGTRAPTIVEWRGLLPGLTGFYQINVRVPGTHINGSAIPVTVKVGGVSSSTTGPVAPTAALN